MQELFSTLSHTVEGAPLLALGASVVWGILSIVLSPCHLASIPLIVGFISGQGRVSTARACGTATLFSVGILVTIAAIGAITAAAGRMMGDVGRWGNYFVAAIFFVVGLYLLGVIPMPWSGPGQVNMLRKGYLAAFLLGLIFGVALGPCTFAYMAPMLAVTFRLANTAPLYGASLLLAYGVGHCSVIVLAGASTEVVQEFLDWNEQCKGVTAVKCVCGVLVLLGGGLAHLQRAIIQGQFEKPPRPMNLTPIGIIHSPHKQAAGAPVQSALAAGVVGSVEVFAQYAVGLRDLDGFERIWLVYWFDRAKGMQLTVKPYLDTVEHGLFATRAPSRPNPIGMSAVRLLAIGGRVLQVRDLVGGSGWGTVPTPMF